MTLVQTAVEPILWGLLNPSISCTTFYATNLPHYGPIEKYYSSKKKVVQCNAVKSLSKKGLNLQIYQQKPFFFGRPMF